MSLSAAFMIDSIHAETCFRSHGASCTARKARKARKRALRRLVRIESRRVVREEV